MKKLSFASGVAAIALAAASIFPAAGVFAKTVASADYTNNPITLKRTITNVTNPVTNTFGYTITKGTTPDGGDVSGFPTTASIAFNNTTPLQNNSVEATTTVNFSAADFTKVGDYYFTIKENSSSDAANYPIDTADNDYQAVVQVRYYTDANNVPDNNRYVATIIVNDKNGTKITNRTATWTSGSTYTYIQASAKTTGNMAEKDQCFEYTIDIPSSVGGTYVIDISNSEGATACSGSATSVAAGTPAKVYLKHGDTVRVGYNGGAYQLPVGTTYKITEANTSDYTEKFDGTNGLSTEKTTVATGDSNFNSSNTTALENNWQSNPLTGIVTNFWFYLILLIAGAFGFFFFMRKRQQDDEEQQQA